MLGSIILYSYKIYQLYHSLALLLARIPTLVSSIHYICVRSCNIMAFNCNMDDVIIGNRPSRSGPTVVTDN